MTPLLDYLARDASVQVTALIALGAVCSFLVFRSTWLRRVRIEHAKEARNHEWAETERREKYQRDSMNLPVVK